MTINIDYLKLIGKTPIVKVNNILNNNCANVYLKLEWFNAGGSIKDRTALKMIEDQELSGRLKPGMTIIESSSGNTAIGLAIICAIKGYKLIAICDRYIPMVKRNKLYGYGADIVFIPKTPEGLDTVELRIELSKKIANFLPNSVTLMQYENPSNPEAHYLYTGQEIWEDFKESLDACVMAVGTCGTISGVGKALKEKNKKIKIYGVEPEGSIIFGGLAGKYYIQGGGLSFIPKILDRNFIDEGFKVLDFDGIKTARELAEKEGLMVGGTGAIVAHTCFNLAKNLGANKNILGIIPDAGDRYLDTIYNNEWCSLHNFIYEKNKIPEKKLKEILKKEGCTLNEF